MPRKFSFWGALLAVLIVVNGGCSSARFVLKEPGRGIVAIPANTNYWPTKHREHARELMQQHFPGGYKIDKEEEVAVGETTATAENGDGSQIELAGGWITLGSHRSTTTKTDVTEYRFEYSQTD